MSVEVRVTHEEIESGRPLDCYECPVARAINRALGNPFRARVTLTTIEVIRFGEFGKREPAMTRYLSFPTPPAVKEFMGTFDIGGADAVKPFEFPMEIPS